MATYTTDARLLRWLPDTLPTSIDASGKRATYIIEASAWVDGAVGQRFTIGSESSIQKFPDVTSSPATPEVIQQAATFRAVGLLYLVGYGDNAAGPSGQSFFDMADDLCARIASGEIEVIDSAGTTYGTRGRLRTQLNSNTEPVFSRGEYDADGNMNSAYTGTLDDL